MRVREHYSIIASRLCYLQGASEMSHTASACAYKHGDERIEELSQLVVQIPCLEPHQQHDGILEMDIAVGKVCLVISNMQVRPHVRDKSASSHSHTRSCVLPVALAPGCQAAVTKLGVRCILADR